MARYGFPFLIISAFVVIAGSAAADWVGGLTLNLASDTAAKIEAVNAD
ncbi:hypothetical protein RPALISO_240 [Ruegeria phage RpAliso]|nr:hypothetical protein RPALISO_240 [Ruegeria phage RpAliso]